MKYISCCKVSFLLYFLFLSVCCFSQKSFTYQGLKFTEQRIKYTKKDTISYLYNSEKVEKQKPAILILQGSLPIPIVIGMNDSSVVVTPIGNFDCTHLFQTFNVILVSKPFTPIFCYDNQLNERYCYVPNIAEPDIYDKDYQAANNLYYLSKRVNFLINKLIQQKVIEKNHFLLFGHSQGARVASRVAQLNSKITDVTLLSESPVGRVQYYLFDNHLMYQNKEITFEEYKKKRDEILLYYKNAFKKKDSISLKGDAYLNLISFSEPIIDDIISTKANVFYGIGSADIPSMFSELISIACVKAGKENISVNIYDGCEHNFFSIDSKGKPIYNQPSKWGLVIDNVIDWYNKNHPHQ